MRWILKSDKSFLDFLHSEKMKGKWILIALVAGLFIFTGSLGIGESDRVEENLDDRVAEICSMTEGVGECRVMVTYTDSGDVFGVAILCQGAESPVVRERLTSLICSVFGIGSNRVEILKISE